MTAKQIASQTDSQEAASGLYRFTSLANAASFRDRMTKTALILLGDDGRFWVTTGRISAKLEAAGYQIAL